jgi:hypothetical protein
MKIAIKNNFQDELFFYQILSCIDHFLLVDFKLTGLDGKYKDYILKLIHNFRSIRKNLIHEPNLILEIYPHDEKYLNNIHNIKSLYDYPLDISNKQYSFYIDFSDFYNLSFYEFEKGTIFSKLSLNKNVISAEEIKTSMLFDNFQSNINFYLIEPIKKLLDTDKDFYQISKEEFQILKLIQY